MADQRLLDHLRLELLHALLQAAGHAGEQGELGGLRFSDRGAQHARTEQFRAEPGRFRQRQHAQDLVLQFAHVARPAIGRDAGSGLAGKTLAVFSECFLRRLEQALGEQRNIHRSFAQRRHVQRYGRQAVVEILAEAPLTDLGLEIAVGRRNHTHVDRHRSRATERAELPFLQHAQQFHLEGRRGLADLVEEDRAAIGLLEAPGAVLVGTGEGAALVAEQFGLEQLVGQRTAVLDDEGLVGPPAAVVDGARHHLLAGSRFAADQYRQVEGCHLPDQGADSIERAARCPDQAVEAELALDALVLHFDALLQHRFGRTQLDRQALVFLLQAPDVVCVAQRHQQLLRLPGLQQVLVDAGLVDAGDDVFGFGIAGEDDAHRIGPAVAHAAQEFDAGRSRHALVAEDDLYPAHRRLAFENRRGGLGVSGGKDLEILLQRASQGFERAHLVVDDEDGGQFRSAHAGTTQSRSRCFARCRGVHDCGDLSTKWKRATW
ncbi:MAG: hypothetical protein BWZ09_02644 [Alphaproteobacteria bacterium ADurb.BinA305]|nr:MAG: hypothetical protein BWZ09_02644 [Alphaproteobacteria bacterium ADurb.BinA305]